MNNLISSGRMGGLLRFQKEVLDPAQDGLGMVAIGLAGFFNDEHYTGMDLDGDLANNFFSQATPQLLGHSANAGTATASFNDLSQLQPEEYDLRYDGAAWQLIRVGDSQVIPMTGTGTDDDGHAVGDEGIHTGTGTGHRDHLAVADTDQLPGGAVIAPVSYTHLTLPTN